MPASYEFLNAVNLRAVANVRDVRTASDLADELRVDPARRRARLREAMSENLVAEEPDLRASRVDAERYYMTLTSEGRAVRRQLGATRA